MTSMLLTSNWLEPAERGNPPELSSLTNLYRLYLYSNQLSGEIPASLGSLSDLRLSICLTTN